MTAARRAAAVLWTLLLALGSVALPAPAAQAAATAPAPAAAAATTDPFAELNSCLVSKKAGDVVIMLDISGSIGATDRDGARIDAATALVRSLERRISDQQSEIYGAKLDVAVAGFGEAVFQSGKESDPTAAQWTGLSASTSTAIIDDIKTYQSHNGKETDYWTALDWIARAEEAHASAAGTPVAGQCHLAFWFTDGAYGITTRNPPDWPSSLKPTPWTPTGESDVSTVEKADAVRDGGAADICRAGGLADRLRTDNITLAAVGLGGNESQFDLMKRIAENPSGDCGKLPANGVFDHADVGNLLLLVESLGSSDTTLTPPTSKPVCARVACSSGHTFKLDSSLRRVHIVGVPSIAGLTVQVKGPKGTVTEIKPVPAGGTGQPQSATPDGVQVSYQWVTDKELTIDMLRPSNAVDWTGTWTVTFIDTTGNDRNAVASTRVSVSADLAVSAANAPQQAQIGENYTLPAKLTALNGGTPLIGEPAPTMALSITAQSAAAGSAPVQLYSGDASKLPAGGVVWKAIPTSMPLGPATIAMTLSVTTVSGIELDPVIREVDVTVIPAKGTPTVLSGAIDFGTVQGTATGTASVQVKGPGCVWVAGTNTLAAQPSGVTGVTMGGDYTSADHCLGLSDGQTAQLPVTATPGQEGNGAVRGQFAVQVAPDGHPERAQTQQVDFTLTLERSAKAPVVILVLVLALLVGIGLPILVLALTRRLAARYPDDVQLVSARIPVLVGGRTLSGHGGAAPELPERWNSVPPPESGRRALLVDGIRLRARSGPLWSASPGYSEAEGRPGTGSEAPFYGGKDHAARLPLAVQGTWSLLFRSPEDLAGTAEAVAGELLLISAPGADPSARRRLLADAMEQGPGAVADLRTAIQAAHGTTPGSGPGAPVPVGVGAPSGAAGGPAPAGPVPGGPPQVPGWGNSAGRPAAPPPASPGWGAPQPTPGWGAAPAPGPTPGWGGAPQQPPAGPPPAAPGWGQQAPETPGWGQQPPGNRPEPPPGQGGWPSGR